MNNPIRTYLNLQLATTKIKVYSFLNYKFNLFGIQLLNTLLGFFAATALSTISAQTGDWGIVAAAIIVTNQEIISKIIYQYKKYGYSKKTSFLINFLKSCNNIKVGILYGLFVDAFKLGS